jgi:SAM-dependent methyltransferase
MIPAGEIERWIQQGYSLLRDLDRYYLLLPDSDPTRRQSILTGFFGVIANDYEGLIDTTRNVENIKNLLDVVVAGLDLSTPRTVIDYGCGTGLSTRVPTPANLTLVGVENSPEMSTAAGGRLMVWNLEDLNAAPAFSLDGAFASYVFHLEPDLAGLQILWSKLKRGALVAMNFHKDQGLLQVREFMTFHKGAEIVIQRQSGDRRHGTYLGYRKP